MTDEQIQAAIHEKALAAVEIPGHEVECDPEEAELMGAFEEDALSADDALESSIDLED